MNPETTRLRDHITSPNLYMAIELSNQQWKLGFTIGFGQPPRLRNLAARNLAGLCEEIELAKARFGLADNIRVLSCYEAGRDGFSRRTPGRCGCIASWCNRASQT